MRRSQNNLAGKHSVLRELGIGTNDPATAMHVLSESSGGSVTVERLQDTATPASIYLKKSRGNLVAQTVVQDDDNIGDLVVQGFVGANNSYQTMGDFRFEVDGSVTDAAYGAPSRMMLKLASGSALVERMRVESDGDVGIGNFSSVAAAGKLDVQGVIAISTEVSTPSQQAGIGKVYTKSDGKLYFISGDVSETDLTASGGSGEANENSFKTISVSGQSDVVADADDDTLTLAAGSNVTITTNAGTDTITVAATDTNTQLTTEAVQDIVGAMFSGNTETRVAVTYQDADGTIDVAVDDMTADTQLTSEQVQDIVGAMFSSNTETRCTVTYQDADGTIDVVVDDLDTNLTTEEVQDIVGAMFSSNTETRITATYEDGDGTIDLVVDDMTANTQLTQEQVEDYAGALVASGGTKTGISVTYQDGTGDVDFVVADLTVASDGGSTGMTPGDTLTIAGGTNCTTATSGDTLTINATDTNTQLSTEQVQDIVGAMFSSNTETRCTVTYEDGDGTIDVVVDDMTADTQLTTEAVQDIVGAMFSSNTETRCTVTYEDGDGTIDVVVDDMTANTQLTQEQVEDYAGALVASGGTKTGIAVTYQDGTGDMDFVVSDLTVTGDSGSTGMTPGDTLTIAGGTNITTAMSGDTLTINQSGGGEANESSFKTISVSGQDDVVADADDDTLTLAAGSNVTITTTAGTDTITFASADTNTQLSTEAVQDIVGAMFSGNTETRCTVTYQDGDGTIDVVVDDMSGGGSGDVEAGSTFTTAGVIMACNGDDKTIDEPGATLTTNGQAMTVSSAVQTSFAVDCGSRDGNGIWTFTTGTGDSGSAQNNQGMVKVIAQTSANASLFLGDTASDTKGGLKYKNNGDSMQLIANGNAVLELDSGKVVDFKISAASKSGQGTATSDFMSSVEITPNRWLEIKIAGVQYFLPAFAASQFS